MKEFKQTDTNLEELRVGDTIKLKGVVHEATPHLGSTCHGCSINGLINSCKSLTCASNNFNFKQLPNEQK